MFSYHQGVGRFILQRTESAYMFCRGENATLKHENAEDGGGVLLNHVLAIKLRRQSVNETINALSICINDEMYYFDFKYDFSETNDLTMPARCLKAR